jgi:hypothetical protein
MAAIKMPSRKITDDQLTAFSKRHLFAQEFGWFQRTEAAMHTSLSRQENRRRLLSFCRGFLASED